MDILRWAVQKRVNQSRYHLGFGLGWFRGTTYLGTTYWMGSRSSHVKVQFLGERTMTRKAFLSNLFCRELHKNGWTARNAVSVVDSGGPKEALLCGMHTGVAPSGEYQWTVCVRRRCGLLSNYFDHLLLLLLCYYCYFYLLLLIFIVYSLLLQIIFRHGSSACEAVMARALDSCSRGQKVDSWSFPHNLMTMSCSTRPSNSTSW